jgi:hypothetical protein
MNTDGHRFEELANRFEWSSILPRSVLICVDLWTHSPSAFPADVEPRRGFDTPGSRQIYLDVTVDETSSDKAGTLTLTGEGESESPFQAADNLIHTAYQFAARGRRSSATQFVSRTTTFRSHGPAACGPRSSRASWRFRLPAGEA